MLIKQYSKDIFTLAKFQIGLAKYFDFFYLGWANEEKINIENKVKEIVIKAFSILQSPPSISQFIQQCNPLHEDGACKINPLGKRCNTLQKHPNWPDLPATEAMSFLNDPNPYPKTLEPRTFIYRIRGNNPCGCWWFTSLFPRDITEWREKLAVLQKWNLGDYYIDLQIPSGGLKIWCGKAASQQATLNCILDGGGEQIWIAPKDIQNICNPIRKQPVPWGKYP